MIKIQENIPLSAYSTLGIGGPARYFACIKSQEELSEAFLFAKEKNIPYFVLGKGSNSLFDDRGFCGLVLLNKLDWIIGGNSDSVEAGSGASFALLGVQTARKGFSGLEFASGIPGSVGGAVYMNAGANGMETKDSLFSVTHMDSFGNVKTYPIEKLKFGYRTSSFQTMDGVIISAKFTLFPSPKAREKQLEIVGYRIQTQPYGEKSAGCIFQNPPNHSAGQLIDMAGLKGFSIGGSKVSEKHANFFLNHKNAASNDILQLIEAVKNQVKEKTGIELRPEVNYIPYDGISR